MTLAKIELFYVAHSRTGDKGDSQTMSLIPYRAEDYALLETQVTADAVRKHFGNLVRGNVTRYALPNRGAFNFVLEETLQGGVNDSLNLDTHGNRQLRAARDADRVPYDHPVQDQGGPCALVTLPRAAGHVDELPLNVGTPCGEKPTLAPTSSGCPRGRSSRGRSA